MLRPRLETGYERARQSQAAHVHGTEAEMRPVSGKRLVHSETGQAATGTLSLLKGCGDSDTSFGASAQIEH